MVMIKQVMQSYQVQHEKMSKPPKKFKIIIIKNMCLGMILEFTSGEK